MTGLTSAHVADPPPRKAEFVVLADFFSWWWRQMRELAGSFAATAAHAPDAIIIAVDQLHLEPIAASGAILLRRNGQEAITQQLDLSRPAETAAWPALPAGLRLPPGMVLRREVALPLAAEREITTVIGFEIDRLTPFAGDEVYWSSSIIAREAGPAGLRVNLFIVLRRPVEALVAALGRLNLRPGFVEGCDGRIALTSGKNLPALWRRPLPILCLILALACIATPVIRQQLALANADRTLATMAPVRREAGALRQRLATAAAAAAVLAAARAQGDVLQILAGLTAALPDGTWLNDLSLSGGDLTFDGKSANAAGLIAILAATPGFHDPAFTAPVTRAVTDNADLFSIHATAAP